MKNVGRGTITSSGPNSFGKTRGGFTDHNAMLERQLQAAMEEVNEDKKESEFGPVSEYGS
jgi:hypothetical protein